MRIERGISGGQTGGDLGFLLACELLGIPTGGTAPAGFRTDVGSAPWLGTRFHLEEHPSPAYPPRTACNVVDSHGTIIFGNPGSKGCTLTQDLCLRHRRSFLIVRWPGCTWLDVERGREWLSTYKIAILNGAGNRERMNPGIQEAMTAFAYWLLAP